MVACFDVWLHHATRHRYLPHCAPMSSLWIIQKTPLWLACSKGHLAAAEVLIEKGAHVDAHVKDDSTGAIGLNCLDVAVKEGHKYVCCSLYFCLSL